MPVAVKKKGKPKAVSAVELKITPTLRDLQRFFADGRIVEDKRSGCWRWQGAQSEHGCTQFSYNDRLIPASWFAYVLLVGPLQPNQQLRRTKECKHANCVNPLHRYDATSVKSQTSKVQ